MGIDWGRISYNNSPFTPLCLRSGMLTGFTWRSVFSNPKQPHSFVPHAKTSSSLVTNNASYPVVPAFVEDKLEHLGKLKKKRQSNKIWQSFAPPNFFIDFG